MCIMKIKILLILIILTVAGALFVTRNENSSSEGETSPQIPECSRSSSRDQKQQSNPQESVKPSRAYVYNTVDDLLKDVMKADPYGFWPEQKVALRKAIERLAKEKGQGITEFCLEMLPEDATPREQHKYIARLSSCYHDDLEIVIELTLRGTSGTYTDGMLNGLKTRLIAKGEIEKLEEIYSQLAPGTLRVRWSHSLTAHKVRKVGATQAIAWIKGMKYSEDQVAALNGVISGLRINNGQIVTEEQKNELLMLAQKHKLMHFSERLELVLVNRRSHPIQPSEK